MRGLKQKKRSKKVVLDKNIIPQLLIRVPGVVEDPGSTSDRTQLNPDSGCGGLLDGDGTAEETDGVSTDSHLHLTSHHHQHYLPRPSSSDTRNSSQQSKELGRSSKDPKHIRYVDGPIDGALYALVNPVKTKAPSSADSGISITVSQFFGYFLMIRLKSG